MRRKVKDGLLTGFGLWLFSMVLGILLGFLQMGYIPRYLLQLIFAIALLVRCCKKKGKSNWIALSTLEALVLMNAVVHVIRSYTEPGFSGLAMLLAGMFGLVSILILAVVTMILLLIHKD